MIPESFTAVIFDILFHILLFDVFRSAQYPQVSRL